MGGEWPLAEGDGDSPVFSEVTTSVKGQGCSY